MTYEGRGRWDPVSEPEEVTRAREELLDALARAGQEAPDNLWILGQRVRYLAEADRWEEAAELSRACDGEGRWLCWGLRGFALHGLGRYEEAEVAFARARATMPGARAREWDALVPVADRSTQALMRKLGENPRALRSRFWRLADPYLLAPGNDRLTEHEARLVMSELLQGSRNVYGLGWGSDLRELLVRYGWEIGWERSVQGDAGSDAVVGHHDPEGRQWTPSAGALENPGALSMGSWIPEAKSPRSSYAPAYARRWSPPQAQLVRLRRDSALLLLAAYELPEMATPPGSRDRNGFLSGGPVPRIPTWARGNPPIRAGLFLLSEGGEEVADVRSTGSAEGTFRIRVPAGRYMASVEVLDPERRRGGWVRVGVDLRPPVPGLPTLSDLLILKDGTPEPGTLEEAIPRLASRPVLTAGGPTVVAWEAYGMAPRAQTVGYGVTLEPLSRSFLHRVGSWLRLVGDPFALDVRWSERDPGTPGPHFHALSLDVPELEPGTYHLRIRLSIPGRDDIVASRIVQVVGRSP